MGGSSTVPAPDIVTNPNSTPGPNLGPLRASLTNQIAGQSGQERQQALAALQGAGVGGTEKENMLGRIAGEQNQNLMGMNAGLANQDFQNQLSLMDEINKARMCQSQFNAQQNEYGQNQQNSQIQGGVSTALSLAKLLAMLA